MLVYGLVEVVVVVGKRQCWSIVGSSSCSRSGRSS